MIAAGFGYRASATIDSLRSALKNAGADARPDCLATLQDKAATLQALSNALGLPLRALTPDEIEGLPTITRSEHALRARSTGSLAEAAALAAAGTGARLLGPRAVSDDRRATCALAEGTLA